MFVTGLKMSINYHAAQNRHVLFSGYEKISSQWYERFTDHDPAPRARQLGFSVDDDWVMVPYLFHQYRLDRRDGHIERKKTAAETVPGGVEDGWDHLTEYERARFDGPAPEGSSAGDEEWTPDVWFNEAMVIYHLFTYAKDHPVLTGKLVPSDSLEQVLSRRQSMPDPLFDPFASEFSGRTEELEARCARLGGVKKDSGDVSEEFSVFPFLKVQLVFWDADEDFPAQVQILVDSGITDYISAETVGCIIADLFDAIEAE